MKLNTTSVKLLKSALVITILLSAVSGCSILNRKTNKIIVAGNAAQIKKDSSVKPFNPRIPKKFNSLITPKSLIDSGLFNVYQLDDKYFIELEDSVLNRDIMVVSRISKASAGVRTPGSVLGYSGDQINSQIIRFEKGPDFKLFMKSVSYSERTGDSTKQMYRSLSNNNLQPIAVSFDIKALSKGERGIIIDISDYLKGDNEILFFDKSLKTALKLGVFQPEKSYISSLKSFPNNIEIKTVKTYSKFAGSLITGNPASPESGNSSSSATFELNTSIVMLPKNPMRPRFADSRVGYFTTGYADFETNPQGVEQVEMITRWRLEPKPEDRERYLRGELVEPVKPIVFYIDPSTPKAWVPYLIMGINDWNAAFEHAGFKNAIIGMTAPTAQEDPEWGLEDARHNAIIYKSSQIANASGPNVNDPRTGEILETHINWYHNVMELLKQWYFIQAAAVDPEARSPQLKEELMGQLIRFVSSHEVGHTLGLRHNLGSSSTVPVELLRNKEWVEKNGHTPSIMDYARFNYVAQPEDHISQKGIFPRIGDYDKWAIEWGYRWFPEKSAEAEKEFMDKWIIERTSKNNRLWFGIETDLFDPRSQSEDLGDNAMLASRYGIKNLKRILPNIIKWNAVPHEGYQSARNMYEALVMQYSQYLYHVTKNIGGVMTTPKSILQAGPVIEIVSRARQKEAMAFLQDELFTTPSWLLNEELFNKTSTAGSFRTVNYWQGAILFRLLNEGFISRLILLESNNPSKAYSLMEMLTDLQSGIFSEIKTGKEITVYRRNLQKSYVEHMLLLCKPPTPLSIELAQVGRNVTDIMPIVKLKLHELQSEIKRYPRYDQVTRLHFKEINDRINETLNPYHIL